MLLYHPATGLAQNPLCGHTTENDSKLQSITYKHTGQLDPSVRQLVHHLKNSQSVQPNVKRYKNTRNRQRAKLQHCTAIY